MHVFISKQVVYIVTTVLKPQEFRSVHLLRETIVVGLFLFEVADLK
jgi:hypothetical protein